MIQPIHTTAAPAPGGHYSQAVNYCALIFVSGQLPVDPATGEKCLGSIEEQTALVLENMRQILLAAGQIILQYLPFQGAIFNGWRFFPEITQDTGLNINQANFVK